MKAIKFFTYFAHIHNILGGLLIVAAIFIFLISSSDYAAQNIILIAFNLAVAITCFTGSIMTLSINRYPVGITILGTLTALQIFSFATNNILVNINLIPSFGVIFNMGQGAEKTIEFFFQIIPHALIDTAYPAQSAFGISIVPLILLFIIFPAYKRLNAELEELHKEKLKAETSK
ncbi:MAG: hypothetical protein JXK07_03100 [Spirochaetes bacterium]|nr:hypothetical protein [Spirochaetota bacterium]MBN2771074.1 hypothetical protein [Spirochaetota bacterium]